MSKLMDGMLILLASSWTLIAVVATAQGDFGIRTALQHTIGGESNVVIEINEVTLSNKVAAISTKFANDSVTSHSQAVTNHVSDTERVNWNLSFSWGNHAGLYKALGWQPDWSDVLNKPTLPTAQQIADWDTAAGWGPHATAGYLKSATDTVARVAIDVLSTGKVSQAQWTAGSNSFATAEQGAKADTAIQSETDPVALGALGQHADSSDNPHQTTALQVGATTPSAVTQIVTSALSGLPIPTQTVVSVNGYTGAVSLTSADVGAIAQSGDPFFTFNVSPEFFFFGGMDQETRIYANSDIGLTDYLYGRGVRTYSLFDVATTQYVNDAVAPRLTVAQGDARYLSSTPGWFLQGSQVISTNTWTTNLTGYAAVSNGFIALVPYTTSRHDVTGTVTVVSQRHIVGVSASWSMALSSDSTMPRTPMGYRAFERVSPTSFTASAWCSTKPADANPYYWGYVSNIIVQTYDRAEMAPGTYTNDAAGIVSRVDSLPTASGVPVTGNGHARAAVNAESMRLYVDARKDEIARSAYNWTPAGRPSPSAQTFTVDEPLVQQGAISYLNSGDYYCMSYAGGDWISSTTGSVWRIGPSGRVSFEIASANRMLHISGFSVAGGYATLDISTNWVVGTPSVEFTDNLANPQWLSCPAQVMSNGVSFWRGTCPAVSSNRFFRVVDPSGDNVIRSHTRHEFLAGVTIGTNTFHSLTELKAQLEALP